MKKKDLRCCGNCAHMFNFKSVLYDGCETYYAYCTIKKNSCFPEGHCSSWAYDKVKFSKRVRKCINQ